VVIAAVSVESERIKKLYELRPGLELRTYLRKDIWDLLQGDMLIGE
jgi:hypothetical protein